MACPNEDDLGVCVVDRHIAIILAMAGSCKAGCWLPARIGVADTASADTYA